MLRREYMVTQKCRGTRGLALLAGLAAAVVVGLLPVSAMAGPRESPKGIYTCDWIAKNERAAALAMVTCDPAVFFAVSTEGPALSALKASSQPLTLLEDGCQHLPVAQGTYVGQGVFAWTSYKYTTQWEWTDQTNPVDYTWYLQTTGGTYTWGDYAGSWTGHGPVNVPANEYRWGAQNHSSTPARWWICWNDN